MAITKFKKVRAQSRRADRDGRAASVEYKLWRGTIDQAEAYAAANVPPYIDSFDSVRMYIESLDVQADPADDRVHTARVEYSSTPRREPSEIGDESVSFDLSAQMTTVTHSLQTVNKYAASGTAPDFKQGIGYDGEGKNFNGAERMIEAFSFAVAKVHPNSAITNAYIQSLRDAAFRWNSQVFRGNAIGEVLFVGASGAPRDKESYSINYKFLCSKNASGLTIGGVSGIDKQGWDHLWVLVEKQNDTTGKFLTPRPKAVYVERLYTSVDFNASLGLTA